MNKHRVVSQKCSNFNKDDGICVTQHRNDNGCIRGVYIFIVPQRKKHFAFIAKHRRYLGRKSLPWAAVWFIFFMGVLLSLTLTIALAESSSAALLNCI